MTVLIDSCIAIDVLRGHSRAIGLIEGLRSQAFASVVTIVELRSGQRGLREAQAIDRFLSGVIVVNVDGDIAEQAGEFMQRFRKSHQLDIADALIAATAVHRGLALQTLKLKHFPMFPHLKAT